MSQVLPCSTVVAAVLQPSNRAGHQRGGHVSSVALFYCCSRCPTAIQSCESPAGRSCLKCMSCCLGLNMPLAYTTHLVSRCLVVHLELNTLMASLVVLSTIPPASCRRRGPPGNAVSGYSSTMCLVVWWLSPQGQAGDAITPHR